MVGAVDKHLALIGFMGAGKTTLGRELARLTQRPFVDTDEEIEKRFGPIGELFERGEPEFRRIEEQLVAEALAGPTSVIALGGGAVLSEPTRKRLRRTAFVAWVPVDVDTAWSRVRESGRPLARDREQFGYLFDARADFYDLLFNLAELGLATLEELADRAEALLDLFVRVDERSLREPRELAAQRRLPGAHEADEREVLVYRADHGMRSR